MKRSEINLHIRNAEQLFQEQGFKLPPWAHWSPEQWQQTTADCSEIADRGLGWDITDFNENRFDTRGLVLFTLRNGRLEQGHKPYAEKAMMVGVDQETPFHYHWTKIEDIINRGGGTLVLELHWEDSSGGLSDTPVEVSIDGIRRRFESGEYVRLTPGESITLPVGLYHRFWATDAPVLAGEVSMVND
ncbi:MAG: D-lyxose/D-mannose family sugar isomerase, partial [Spirochaetota bacterium]